MTQSVLGVMLYSLIPVFAALAGASIAALRAPGARVRSGIQHFAAGVVFSVVSVELLPDVVRRHRPLWVVVGFGLGIASMLALRWFIEAKIESRNRDGSKAFPIALVTATGIDILLDGFLVGIGFVAGAKEGMLLVFALGLELFSLGVATGVTLMNSGVAGGKSISTTVLLALAIPVGALAGTTILRNAPDQAVEMLLSFGLAALLFLVTEELLVEAHEVQETPLITTSFFAGFLVFLVLGMVT